MSEPGCDNNDPSPLMDVKEFEMTIRVEHVRARPRKLKMSFPQSDLVVCHGSVDTVSLWEKDAYYVSNRPRRVDGITLPPGTYWVCVDTGWKPFHHQEADEPVVMGGRIVVLKTPHPNDPSKRLQVELWSAITSAEFDRVREPMTVLALAGTI